MGLTPSRFHEPSRASRIWAALLSKKRAPSSRRRMANLVASVTRAPAFVFGQELADHLFAEPVAIDVGGVPEIDAKIDRPRHRPQGIGFGRGSVEAAEAHGAKADGRNRSLPPNAPSHLLESLRK